MELKTSPACIILHDLRLEKNGFHGHSVIFILECSTEIGGGHSLRTEGTLVRKKQKSERVWEGVLRVAASSYGLWNESSMNYLF